jgi:hypothetical protein
MFHVALVGPELEENLSLRYLSSSLMAAGFECRIIAFNFSCNLPEVLAALLAAGPGLIGLSLSFQLRAKESNLLDPTGSIVSKYRQQVAMSNQINRKESYMKRFVVGVLFALAAAAAVALAADPWVGTWKLDPDKSKSPGGRLPHPTSTNIIEIKGKTMHLISNQTDASGKLERVEYTAKLDGKEYPVKSSPPGPQPYTISLKRIDQRTREFVEIIGKITIKGRDVLSKDGKSFDRIVSSKDAQGNDASVIQVFVKQ